MHSANSHKKAARKPPFLPDFVDLVAPEAVEAPGVHPRIARGVRHVAMAEIGLQLAGAGNRTTVLFSMVRA